MMKKPASFVLASLGGSTPRGRFSEMRNTGGIFPFAKIHCMGERLARSAVCISSPPRSLRLRPGNSASRRAGAGWMKTLVFLIILRESIRLVNQILLSVVKGV